MNYIRGSCATFHGRIGTCRRASGSANYPRMLNDVAEVVVGRYRTYGTTRPNKLIPNRTPASAMRAGQQLKAAACQKRGFSYGLVDTALDLFLERHWETSVCYIGPVSTEPKKLRVVGYEAGLANGMISTWPRKKSNDNSLFLLRPAASRPCRCRTRHFSWVPLVA